MGTVASYKSFSLQSLSHKSNAVSQRLQLELVAYESGHKESCFDCIWTICFQLFECKVGKLAG